MKLLGAVLVLGAGALWGWDRARRLGERERLLLDWKRLIQRLNTEIGYTARPLAQLLLREGASSRFCREAAGDPAFAADPQRALGAAGERLLERPGDRELFRAFAQGLGASGVEGQLEHLALCQGLLGPILEEAREEREKKSKLYLALGAFAGIALCLALF